MSILLLIFNLLALAIAILLSIRHGLSRFSGWRFMIIFTLARILCAYFQLATNNQQKIVSLYVVLIGVAVSPLELVAFGMYIPDKLLFNFQGLGGLSGVESPIFCTDISISTPTKTLALDETC